IIIEPRESGREGVRSASAETRQKSFLVAPLDQRGAASTPPAASAGRASSRTDERMPVQRALTPPRAEERAEQVPAAERSYARRVGERPGHFDDEALVNDEDDIHEQPAHRSAWEHLWGRR